VSKRSERNPGIMSPMNPEPEKRAKERAIRPGAIDLWSGRCFL